MLSSHRILSKLKAVKEAQRSDSLEVQAESIGMAFAVGDEVLIKSEAVLPGWPTPIAGEVVHRSPITGEYEVHYIEPYTHAMMSVFVPETVLSSKPSVMEERVTKMVVLSAIKYKIKTFTVEIQFTHRGRKTDLTFPFYSKSEAEAVAHALNSSPSFKVEGA